VIPSVTKGWIKGRPRSEESKKKISEGMKGVGKGGLKKRGPCPICSKDISLPNMWKHRPLCEELHNNRDMFPTYTSDQFGHYKTKLKVNFGLTLPELRKMWDKQGRVCAICKQGCEVFQMLSVDHCHTTGVIRGLLCAKCNPMLGMAEDNINILMSAIDYLIKPYKD
jgi:hypothetical protein